MPVCEKTLRQRQHAKVAGGIRQQGRRLANDQFQRARHLGRAYSGTNRPKDDGMENASNGFASGSRRQSRTRVRRKEYAKHGNH